MHVIYLVSGNNPLLMRAVRLALEKEFPSQTFDCDQVHGVEGVRIHTNTEDLKDPVVKECRDYARGFLSCLRMLTE